MRLIKCEAFKSLWPSSINQTELSMQLKNLPWRSEWRLFNLKLISENLSNAKPQTIDYMKELIRHCLIKGLHLFCFVLFLLCRGVNP